MIECNPLFNRKEEKVDNLNNIRFSHNSIYGVVGHGSTIDGNIFNLTHILNHNFAPKLVFVNVSVYWDKALLLDFYWPLISLLLEFSMLDRMYHMV